MEERKAPRALHESATLVAGNAALLTPQHALLHEGQTELIACVGDCLILAAHTFTARGVAALGRAMNQLVQRHGAFRVLTLAERRSGSEAVDESRVALSELVQQQTRNFRASAIVSESTGFRATALRSTVTAIHMAGRASHPTQIFDSVPPALNWLASMRPELPLDIGGVARAVESLRARLNATSGQL